MTGFEVLLKKWNGNILHGAQTRLALKMGVDRTTVSRWCSGLPPGEDLRERLADAMGVKIEELQTAFEIAQGRQFDKMWAGEGGIDFQSMKAQIDQQAKQITELQERIGELSYRLKIVERTRRDESIPTGDTIIHPSPPSAFETHRAKNAAQRAQGRQGGKA